MIVGFAAEDGEGAIESARGKLERKRLDLLVVNDISLPGIGFEVSKNAVTILTAGGAERWVPRTAKLGLARTVLDEAERARERRWMEPPDQARVRPQESEAFAAIARRVPKNVCRAVQVLARQR